jgi:glycosyltransferase involved in cell wall biosynthesis
MDPRITVIIPTTAAPERRDYLSRSIDSVLTQTGVDVRVLLIANGDRCDDALLASLRENERVTVVRISEGSLPLALKTGRKYVETPFFAELDDDDLLLPQGLHNLSLGFHRHPDADVIVGNGYLRCEGSADIEINTDAELLRRDPLRALLQQQWLSPGGALFRSSEVSQTDFSNIAQYYEWTYLAAFLCLNHKLSFISSPVFVHHKGLPFSIDMSRKALFGRPKALKEILSLPLPSDVKRGFLRKLGGQYHDCSTRCLQERKQIKAITFHLISLTYPGGWRYLSYSRHLLSAALSSSFTNEKN